jgi:hypothetical protein
MLLYKNCGRWKNFDCIFEFSVKSSIRIRYFLSCAKKKVKFCCPAQLEGAVLIKSYSRNSHSYQRHIGVFVAPYGLQIECKHGCKMPYNYLF